ncbi:DUF262 domain-containing protein [Clostridium gasigenes]|uniref:DUF262 domain-containing protein n=1 Tax=Clostridium gasigenes TaxID=94869 RepID=UPI00311A9F62
MNWNNSNELEVSPKFQRNPVWNDKAKSYLIDSILRGLPVPQIFIRQIIDIHTRKTNREVIDGQQRLRTIIEYVDGKFPVMKSHNEKFGGLKFSELDEEAQEEFLEYELPVEVIKCKEDYLIYDMFARVNTNSMTLNSQELRNAKYWGDFKVFIYSTTAKYRKFLIDIKMFTDKQLSRMVDIEFLSSLVIGSIDGIITDSASKIDSYYKKFDGCFDKVNKVEYEVRRIFEVIEELFESNSYNIVFFHRKVYFYTLYMTLNHFMFKIEGFEVERPIEYIDENINKNIDKLIYKLSNFESLLERYSDGMLYEDTKDLDIISIFDRHHLSRTTSSFERRERVEILCNRLMV